MHTLGFCNRRTRLDHYDRHGGDFGATRPEEYEQMADEFLGGPRDATTLECDAKHGAILRYDPKTNTFGSLNGDGRIKTYFKPRRGEHTAPSNFA